MRLQSGEKTKTANISLTWKERGQNGKEISLFKKQRAGPNVKRLQSLLFCTRKFERTSNTAKRERERWVHRGESHDTFTHSVVVGDCADLVIVLALWQHVQTVRVEAATAGVQLLSVLLAQLRAKWVDCDDESTAVSLKLKTRRLRTLHRDAMTINTLLWSKLQGLVQDSLPK